MAFNIEICVTYIKDTFDPQSRAIEDAVKGLNERGSTHYDIADLTMGKYFSYRSNKNTKEEALEEAKKLCEDLLANPVIEDSRIISCRKEKRENPLLNILRTYFLR